MVPHEDPEALVPQLDRRWYDFLWEAMVEGAYKPAEILSNKLSIVTFNYDRSLEHFLLTSIEHSFGIETEAAAEIVSALPITHVYGTLGGLPYGQAGRKYSNAFFDRVTIKKAAEQIKLVGDRQDRNREIAVAMSSCDILAFVGFGYLAENIEQLSLDRLSPLVPIFGTAYGMGRGEQDAAQKLLRSATLRPDNPNALVRHQGVKVVPAAIELRDRKCLSFLQECPIL
ncbi:hypothetical protein ABI59_14975 [Acidobacteria bacterium Mor1]|nr:hypothetical protein ABI59_14975 [Acidobacteria bacterium Mor1]